MARAIRVTVSGIGVVAGVIMPMPQEGKQASESGEFGLSLPITTGQTVQLQRSTDNGTSWQIVEEFEDTPVEKIGREAISGAMLRLECTVFAGADFQVFLGSSTRRLA